MNTSPSTLVLRYRDPTNTFNKAQVNITRFKKLENLQVSAPIGILARLSGFRIDPLTLATGRILLGKFNLGNHGSARLADALSKLDSFPSLQSLLWFGFGLKHVVHILADTLQGAACVAVCACLSEVHSELRAAHIVDALASLLWADEDEELRPSLTQWKYFIRSCQGLFAGSTFGLLAEQLMSLADSPSEPRVGHESYAGWNINSREAGGIMATAQVLLALSDVTNGQLSTISIIGGAECVFVIALAEWLFGLSTAVIQSSTSEYIYKSGCIDAKEAQISWILSPPERHQPSKTNVVSKTYVIPNGNDMFVAEELSNRRLSGRVPWESLLAHCFGEKGRRLLTLPVALGNALGAAARILTSAASGDLAVTRSQRRQCCFYHDDSHGMGFINTAVLFLPELKSTRNHMEVGIQGSFKEAAHTYFQAMAQIAMSCGCAVCSQETLDNLDDSTYDDLAMEPFCLTLLTSVIICLVQALSCVDFPSPSYHQQLNPSRLGIELFYLLCRERGRIIEPTVERLLNDSFRRSLLSEVSLFFGGRHPNETQGRSLSAIVSCGLCFYNGLMTELTDDPSLAYRITVVPGSISRGYRTYTSVYDWKNSSPSYPATKITVEPVPPELFDSSPHKEMITTSVVVAESLDAIALSFRLTSQNGECWIGPSWLLTQLTHAYQFSPRFRHSRCAKEVQLSQFSVLDGEGSLPSDVKRLALRLVGRNNVPARCIAFAHGENQTVLLKEGSCLSCCLSWVESWTEPWDEALGNVEIIA
jgi:hypothetical protein